MEPGFALPDSESSFVPGFGCMVTKQWAEAYKKKHVPLQVEIARTNMQRYGDKVTDVQSKASLLRMLGESLAKTEEGEAAKEGEKYLLEARELIRSTGERSTEDILSGVWPEACVRGWHTFCEQLDPSERNAEMDRMVEMINLTRKTINSMLERWADDPGYVYGLHILSKGHFTTELGAIYNLSLCFSSLNEKDTERWLAFFEKRVGEIETVYERKGWNVQDVRNAKVSLIDEKCRLYERQEKVELAVELVRKVLKEEGHHALLDNLHVELSLKAGRIEEGFKSMEKILLAFRSKGQKGIAAHHFNHYLRLVPEESMPLFKELIPKYPHILWAVNAAGYVELSEEKKKTLQTQLETKKGLRSQLESKETLRCVNCSEELSKVYRCSRCDIATYCGSACQKEAWKEHKKICKKRE
jgi:hypothetical protein